MKGINKVILLGNIGQELELFEGGSFKSVSFSFATSEKYKDKEGKLTESTEWHRVIFYNNLAETLVKYAKKGDPLYIEGTLKTKKSEKDGVARYFTEVRGVSFNLLPSNRSNVNEVQEAQAGQGDVPF